MVDSISESSIRKIADQITEGLIRVLHVDDELGFLKVARDCLETEGGFQVDSANSVKEALKKMSEKAYRSKCSSQKG